MALLRTILLGQMASMSCRIFSKIQCESHTKGHASNRIDFKAHTYTLMFAANFPGDWAFVRGFFLGVVIVSIFTCRISI